jgi:hypothetical protein
MVRLVLRYGFVVEKFTVKWILHQERMLKRNQVTVEVHPLRMTETEEDVIAEIAVVVTINKEY